MLEQTLASIAKLSYPLDNIEVIVVSQTPEITDKQLIGNCGFSLQVLLQPEEKNISTLRNLGVKHSSGQYLAFLDADIAISPNWASTVLSLLDSTPKRAIISGMQVSEPTAPPLEHIRTCISSAERDTNVAFLPGCNLFLTRETFDRTGGFPEHLITCEDYYFTDKASQFGDLYRTSEATYLHLGEDKTFSQMFKKELWRGQSNLQSTKGRRIPLREMPSFIIPLWICLFFTLTLISLLIQALPMALLFCTLGTGPLLAYSIRLYRLSKHTINFGSIVKFYAVYFLARATGTLIGLFTSIGTHHK